MSPEDLRALIPQHKRDFDRANALVDVGYPAVAPILPRLLVWLQDSNWPISSVLSNFLASIGAPLSPHLREILAGDDGSWKSSIMRGVIGANTELFALFKGELERIANSPTLSERAEQVDEDARDILAHGPVVSNNLDPRIDSRQPDPRWRPR